MLTSLTKQLRGLFAFLNHMWNLRNLEIKEIFVPKILPHKGYRFEYSPTTRKWEQPALLSESGPSKTEISVAGWAESTLEGPAAAEVYVQTSTENNNDH